LRALRRPLILCAGDCKGIRVDRSDHDAAPPSDAEGVPPANEDSYVSPVPGCILLAIGALMVLLLAAGWML